MIRLSATTQKLQLVLASAITTSQLPVVCNWADKTSSAYTGGVTVNNSNSTTAVDIVAAPAASTIRDIDSILVRNADTVSATVTLRYNNNGTTYDFFKATIDTGDQISYTHGEGLKVLNSDGSIKYDIGNINIGTGTTDVPANYLLGSAAYVDVTGLVKTSAPVTTTASAYTVSSSDTWLIVNYAGTHTLTLPTASSNTGRCLTVKTLTANTVVSASSDVAPIDSATAGTAILAATAGKWARMVSNGTNWVILESN